MLGLLSDLPRKACWTLAEHARDATPNGMQHLLARAVWDEDGIRDDLRAYVVEHLGDPQAVLVVDETGDLKKGGLTVGVQRQYTGTLRVELEARGIGCVLAMACAHPVLAGGKAWRADGLRKRVPARAWQCVSAGRGAKGHRYYDWASIRLDPSEPAHGP